MPNWCASEWIVSGDSQDVQNFVSSFKAAHTSGILGGNASSMIKMISMESSDPNADLTIFACMPAIAPRRGYCCVWDPSYEVKSSVNPKVGTCDFCSCNRDLKRCGNCKSVCYCSVACQQASWEEHKKVCSPGRMSIMFTSKWRPPYGPTEYAKIAAGFPKVVVEVKYGEQSCNFCGTETLLGGVHTNSTHQQCEEGWIVFDENKNEFSYSGPFAKVLSKSG